MYKAKIKQYLESNKQNIVNDFLEILKIPSVRGRAEEGAPFGKECAKALEKIKELYDTNGFETDYDKNGGYLLSYYGKGEKSIGIFAHADTVKPGDNWIYTSPFEPVIKDGCIICRGAIDNKAGVIISLYCAKILKELTIPFKSRLVMFTGSDEESGMADIKSYLKNHTVPDFSLVPDTGFPLFRGNKGKITCTLKSGKPLSKGVSLYGGSGASVIGLANAKLPYSEEILNNKEISAEKVNHDILLTAKGISKHPATPQGGLSAFVPLCENLIDFNIVNGNDREIVQDIKNMSESMFGEFFDINKNDSDYGPLTCVMTRLETDEKGFLTALFNIRYGESANKDEVLEKIKNKAANIMWQVHDIVVSSTPSMLSADNKYVKALLNVYEKETGHKNPPSYINAGGTYRQYLKNAVEIGNTLKWEKSFDLPKGHGGAHESDEFVNINGILRAIDVILSMILEIDKM